MKKTITIGKKIDKRRYYILIFICFSLPLFVSILSISYGLHHLFNPVLPIILGIILIIIVLIFMIPFFGTNQYLELSDTKIIYSNHETFGEQLNEIIHFIQRKESIPDIEVDIKDIKYLKLDYRSTQMMGLKGYVLVLNLQLDDNTVIQISPDYLVSEKGIYLKAIEYLEELGVQIIDDKHIKPSLISDARYFQEYIQKENHHG